MLIAGKESPSVLLTGRTGQIGSELERQLAPLVQLTALDRRQLDLEKPNLAQNVVRDIRPAVIINAAAYTSVDQAEREPERACSINAESVGGLAAEAGRIGALLVHYSTDYVFDGSKPTPYEESDIPNPLNVYGKTKLAGEQAIKDWGCFYLIIRTTWIYAATGKNFVRTIARLAQAEAELKIVDDQRGAPTSANDVANATLQILAQISPDARHLYHVTAAGETTWYGLAKEVVAELALRKHPTARLKPITTAEYPVLAQRPLNSLLSNETVERDFGIRMPHWSESLQRTLRQLVT